MCEHKRLFGRRLGTVSVVTPGPGGPDSFVVGTVETRKHFAKA